MAEWGRKTVFVGVPQTRESARECQSVLAKLQDCNERDLRALRKTQIQDRKISSASNHLQQPQPFPICLIT